LTTFNIGDRFSIGDIVCFYNSDALVGIVVGEGQNMNNKDMLYRVDWFQIEDERVMK